MASIAPALQFLGATSLHPAASPPSNDNQRLSTKACFVVAADNQREQGRILKQQLVSHHPKRGRIVEAVRTRTRSVTASVAVSEGATSEGLKGRPVVILPGLGNNTGDYDQLTQDLQAHGLPTAVARVSRPDWLRNAAGLVDPNYWKGTLQPRPVLDWYLERIEAAIEEAKKAAAASSASGGVSSKVALIGHSAGGWLARLYLAEIGFHDVDLLLTLGTPHLAPPRGIPGVVDQTRGLLHYVNDNFPGAFHQPDVKYVCVAGRYLKGSPLFNKTPEIPEVLTTGVGAVAGAAASVTPSPEALLPVLAAAEAGQLAPEDASVLVAGGDAKEAPVSFQNRIVGQGYKQVCGHAEVWGDGVVPEVSALLEGAHNVVLHGVYHSPVGAQEGGRPWYGSRGVLDQWVHHLLE